MISTSAYELEALGELADKSSVAMMEMLSRKYEAGYRGWDDPKMLGTLKDMLSVRINLDFDAPDNMIHIMNLAAMIWNQVGGE